MPERFLSPDQYPEHDADRLSIQTAIKLLLLSFDHSQGGQEIQKLLFQFTHLQRPNWRVEPEWEAQFDRFAPIVLLNFL